MKKLRGKSRLVMLITFGFFLTVYSRSFSRWLRDVHLGRRDTYSSDDIQQLLARLHSSTDSLQEHGSKLTSHAGPLVNAKPSNDQCLSPVTNIAYIRTHKTGSTTLSHIINRYGYEKNLSFILDQNFRNGRNFYMNITEAFERKSLVQPLQTTVPNDGTRPLYNIITLHMQYDRDETDKFMMPNTQYITSLRDPATQFESAFAHFKFDQVFGKERHVLSSRPIEDSIAEWLKRPEVYLDRLRRAIDHHGGEVEMLHLYARNGQMNDLGFENKHHGDPNKVTEYIASLDKDFDLVLITEYFDESLMILKKQFCWQIEDILYVSENQRLNVVNSSEVTGTLRDSIREWNSADFQLYQHFNRTLWKKIQDYGPQFSEDLNNFRKRLKEVLNDCTNGQVAKGRKFFRRTVYKKKKNFPDYCNLLVKTKDEIVLQIREKQLQHAANS